MKTKLDRHQGFTLIELLVVIAIIAILAGMLLPGVAEDPLYNLGLKKESWPPEPSRFIMMHEATAYPWSNGSTVEVTQWHEAANAWKAFNPTTIKGDRDKLVGPILFVDGHMWRCDFTAIIKNNPLRALEATQDWMWYKAK